MFTRLFYRSLASRFYGDFKNFDYTNLAGMTVKPSNTNADLSAFSSISTALKNFNTANKTAITGSKVAFGDGNTPVTPDDFNLAGNSFTTYSASYGCSFSEDNTEVTWIYTLNNTGTTEFTVREVGVFTYAYKDTIVALVYREVLDTPVTIPPNGVGQVTVTFKVNVPES